ncbi:MAG: helix-turn-helix domain-containing protein, partial [Methylococcaceae bacterium]|nr:helix-turn-helix domain-containing protein [Methylococcaceae bacterium]
QKIKHIKKTSKGGADFRKLVRLQALLAYYRHPSCLNQIALHFDLSVKSLKRWIKRYESDGAESLRDRDRKGRPCQLTAEQKVLLKAELARDKQRVWVARHIAVLLQTLFGVAYSVGYLPEFLRSLGLSFRKLKRAGGFSTRMKLAFKPKEPWQPPGASGDRRSKSPTMDGMDE